MPELSFSVEGVEPVPFAASPHPGVQAADRLLGSGRRGPVDPDALLSALRSGSSRPAEATRPRSKPGCSTSSEKPTAGARPRRACSGLTQA